MGEHRSRRTVIVASIFAVVTVVAGMAIAADALQDRRSAETSLGGQPAATGSTTNGKYCPTREEMDAYWQKHGLERKQDPGCPDPDPLPTADPTMPPEASDSPSGDENEPHTWADAQLMFDPNDDPVILVDRAPDGRFMSVLISPVSVDYVPPASIKTADEYAKWLAQKDQGAR